MLDRFLNPLTIKRLRKFKSIKRAYISFWIFMSILGVSLGAEFIANSKPLFVSYKGDWYFPIFKVYRGTDFGGFMIVEPDYKDPETVAEIEENGFMIKPLVWWGFNETNRNLAAYPGPPNKENWLGTDDRGRDVFVRILYGVRVSLVFAILNLFFALILGSLIGGVQGFFAGKVDIIGQRLVEIWVSLPYIYVVILLVNIEALKGQKFLALILITAAFTWIGTSYYMRAEALRLRNKDFVRAARSLGANHLQIFFKHIIPNAITPIVTLIPFIMAGAILTLSFLDYLGLGVQAPTASLGELLRQGREHFLFSWWLAVYPFFALVITLNLLNLVGEGVRKAFDPRATV